MKKIITTTLLICASLFAHAQFKVGLKLLPYTNLASVKDNNGTSSGIDRRADGYTVKADNEGGFGIGITIEYPFNDNFSFLTGLTFLTKNYHIGNYDGYGGPGNYPSYYNYNYNGYYYANNTNYAYYGTSRYKTTYMQLPLAIKYTSKEVVSKLKIYAALGITLDIKMNEKVDGGDYAHYWNMAQNNPSWADRDRNASGKKMGLFNPFDFGILFNVGATYEVIENLDVYAGFMLNKNFVNQVNPKLRFAEPTQTKVNSDVSWKSCLIGAEIGVSYRLSK